MLKIKNIFLLQFLILSLSALEKKEIEKAINLFTENQKLHRELQDALSKKNESNSPKEEFKKDDKTNEYYRLAEAYIKKVVDETESRANEIISDLEDKKNKVRKDQYSEYNKIIEEYRKELESRKDKIINQRIPLIKDEKTRVELITKMNEYINDFNEKILKYKKGNL